MNRIMQDIVKIKLLASKIRQARLEAAMSQKDLGSLLQLSDRSISAYEQGRATPPLQTLRSLSRVTRKPLDYFTDETQSVQSNLDLAMRVKRIELELLAIQKTLIKHGLLEK